MGNGDHMYYHADDEGHNNIQMPRGGKSMGEVNALHAEIERLKDELALYKDVDTAEYLETIKQQETEIERLQGIIETSHNMTKVLNDENKKLKGWLQICFETIKSVWLHSNQEEAGLAKLLDQVEQVLGGENG